jgi:flagellin
MDVLGSTGQVELNLFRTQMDMGRQVRALASGLRVVSASDDPSGLAIATNIQTQVAGLQQGVNNVQNAQNLLDVADSTLAQVQGILSRIHSLIVEAASDINSLSQLQSIQTEISTLLQEVNKIASSANYNGINLFNGSLASYTAHPATVVEVQSPALPDGSTPTGSQVSNWDGVSGQPGNLLLAPGAPGPNSIPQMDPANAIASFITVQVIGYSANAVDPDTGTAIGPGDYIKLIAYSTNPGMGAAPLYEDVQAIPVNAGVTPPATIQTPAGTFNLLDVSLANLTAQDVGTSISFITTTAQAATQGTPLQFNSSGQEGGIIQVALPSLTTTSLNISDINVLPTQVQNFLGQVTGTVSNQYSAGYAELRVQAAIDSISNVRAQVGAQAVALNQESNDAGTQIVQQTASESSIRDANVGQAVTALTQDRVLTQIDVAVQAQMQIDAHLVYELVNTVNPSVRGLV